MRPWRWLLAAVIVAGLVAAAVWGFLEAGSDDGDEGERPIAGPRRVSDVDGEAMVTLGAAAQRANGLATATLRKVPYHRQLRAYGSVLDLEPLTDLGNRYVAALSARQIAQARLAASKPAFERAVKVHAEGGGSLANAQAAEATFRSDEASVAAAESQLDTLATTAQQIWGPVLARGLIDRTPMFVRLIERREVLVQVTLPPGIAAANPPSTAVAELVDGARTPLAFVSPATKTDPRIQGLSFFFTAAARTTLLPGMSMAVFVPSDTIVSGVVVPVASVVWWRGQAWIYLRTGPDRFVRRAIATDLPTPEGGYVVQELGDGSEVVTRGAQMLLSEEQKGRTRAGDDDQ